MKVQCSNCKRKDFETTERYKPDVTPNGSFVKCLLPYHIDWLTKATTLASEMNCPECGCSLAPSGRLTVISEVHPLEIGIPGEPEPVEPEPVEPEPVEPEPVEPEPKSKKKKRLWK